MGVLAGRKKFDPSYWQVFLARATSKTGDNQDAWSKDFCTAAGTLMGEKRETGYR